MKNILIMLNDPPYGTESSYNGLRLAKPLSNEGARFFSLHLLKKSMLPGLTGKQFSTLKSQMNLKSPVNAF